MGTTDKEYTILQKEKCMSPLCHHTNMHYEYVKLSGCTILTRQAKAILIYYDSLSHAHLFTLLSLFVN